jgi:pimeloyl-ACP methyl ester carboxylesterase
MRIPESLQRLARNVMLPRAGLRLFFYDTGPDSGSVPAGRAAGSRATILVHGLGDEADTWRRVIGPLSRSARVVAPDLPGFGRSTLPGHRLLTPPFLAGVLLELLDLLGIASATWVGSSLGASLSQVAAIRRPDIVSGLVLVDGGIQAHAPLRGALLAMLIPGVGERRYRGLANDLGAAYESLRPYYANLDGLPGAERDFLRDRVKDRVRSATQRRAYFSMLRGYTAWVLLAGRRAARRLQSLQQKTLSIWGSEDHIVPAGPAGRSGHPGARVAIIRGAGHLPHQESPEEFMRLVLGI